MAFIINAWVGLLQSDWGWTSGGERVSVTDVVQGFECILLAGRLPIRYECE